MTLTAVAKADPKAVAVARAVYDAVPLDAVILFGSRARGDHRPDSDIDLMLIHSAPVSNDDYRKATIAAHDAIEEAFGTRWIVGVDLLTIPKTTYMRCRRGINHVTAQAARDGVDMNGDKQEYERDPEPFDWHDIQQRVITANRNLRDLESAISAGQSQEAIGFFAQQAVENILKAWISAAGAEYRNTHELSRLLGIIKNIPEEQDTTASDELFWLTRYAVRYRYEGAALAMDAPIELYERIEFTIDAIEQRIKQLTGVDELPRYTPPTQRLTDAQDEPLQSDDNP